MAGYIIVAIIAVIVDIALIVAIFSTHAKAKRMEERQVREGKLVFLERMGFKLKVSCIKRKEDSEAIAIYLFEYNKDKEKVSFKSSSLDEIIKSALEYSEKNFATVVSDEEYEKFNQ